MKVLVACEFSGVVRRAFRDAGHDAFSCDLLPAMDGENEKHYQMQIEGLLHPTGKYAEVWDLIIAHPPCTHLCVSGARWFKNKKREQYEALKFFEWILNLPCKRLCVENPIGICSSVFRKPDQIIQPWQFGHGETKATCLWLKGLPKLYPTNVVSGRAHRIHEMPPGSERAKQRSITYEGIAKAMAEQWPSNGEDKV